MTATVRPVSYTHEEKAEAVAHYLAHGLGATHAWSKTEARPKGISKPTLMDWLRKAGHDPAEIASRSDTKTTEATRTRVAQIEGRKAAFAADLMDDLKKLRAQLWAPCIEQKVVTLSGGKDSPATWEIAEVERDKPTFAEQVKILTAIGIAVDKVQVLTGGATERIDITGDVRTRALELADELAERRARKAS
jgi:transposase-like protein